MVRWSPSPFHDHKSTWYVWKKEQNEYGRLGHEHPGIVNDVELLSGYWSNLGVNTVCKIPMSASAPHQKNSTNTPMIKHQISTCPITSSISFALFESHMCYLQSVGQPWIKRRAEILDQFGKEQKSLRIQDFQKRHNFNPSFFNELLCRFVSS